MVFFSCGTWRIKAEPLHGKIKKNQCGSHDFPSARMWALASFIRQY